MLYRSNILALVGSPKNQKYTPNKVILWDDHQSKGKWNRGCSWPSCWRDGAGYSERQIGAGEERDECVRIQRRNDHIERPGEIRRDVRENRSELGRFQVER